MEELKALIVKVRPELDVDSFIKQGNIPDAKLVDDYEAYLTKNRKNTNALDQIANMAQHIFLFIANYKSNFVFKWSDVSKKPLMLFLYEFLDHLNFYSERLDQSHIDKIDERIRYVGRVHDIGKLFEGIFDQVFLSNAKPEFEKLRHSLVSDLISLQATIKQRLLRTLLIDRVQRLTSNLKNIEPILFDHLFKLPMRKKQSIHKAVVLLKNEPYPQSPALHVRLFHYLCEQQRNIGGDGEGPLATLFPPFLAQPKQVSDATSALATLSTELRKLNSEPLGRLREKLLKLAMDLRDKAYSYDPEGLRNHKLADAIVTHLGMAAPPRRNVTDFEHSVELRIHFLIAQMRFHDTLEEAWARVNKGKAEELRLSLWHLKNALSVMLANDGEPLKSPFGGLVNRLIEVTLKDGAKSQPSNQAYKEILAELKKIKYPFELSATVQSFIDRGAGIILFWLDKMAADEKDKKEYNSKLKKLKERVDDLKQLPDLCLLAKNFVAQLELRFAASVLHGATTGRSNADVLKAAQ